jgi:hypothetical protein
MHNSCELVTSDNRCGSATGSVATQDTYLVIVEKPPDTCPVMLLGPWQNHTAVTASRLVAEIRCCVFCLSRLDNAMQTDYADDSSTEVTNCALQQQHVFGCAEQSTTCTEHGQDPTSHHHPSGTEEHAVTGCAKLKAPGSLRHATMQQNSSVSYACPGMLCPTALFPSINPPDGTTHMVPRLLARICHQQTGAGHAEASSSTHCHRPNVPVCTSVQTPSNRWPCLGRQNTQKRFLPATGATAPVAVCSRVAAFTSATAPADTLPSPEYPHRCFELALPCLAQRAPAIPATPSTYTVARETHVTQQSTPPSHTNLPSKD